MMMSAPLCAFAALTASRKEQSPGGAAHTPSVVSFVVLTTNVVAPTDAARRHQTVATAARTRASGRRRLVVTRFGADVGAESRRVSIIGAESARANVPARADEARARRHVDAGGQAVF